MTSDTPCTSEDDVVDVLLLLDVEHPALEHLLAAHGGDDEDEFLQHLLHTLNYV